MGTQSAASRPIIRVRLNDGSAAKTDGVNIYVDDRLHAIQLKCAVLYEEIHLERGHSTHQVESVEMSVRSETARRLLPDFAGQCHKDKTVREAANNLGVTRQVLMDRAAMLSDSETKAARCHDCQKCPVMAFLFPKRAGVQALDAA